MGAGAFRRVKESTPPYNRAAARAPRLHPAGVDLTLIRWMAGLTPTQRLAVLQDHVNLVTALRRASTAD
jgi:hypothetical protein